MLFLKEFPHFYIEIVFITQIRVTYKKILISSPIPRPVLIHITQIYATYEKIHFLSPMDSPGVWVKKSEFFCISHAGSGEGRLRRVPRDGKRRAYSEECVAFFLFHIKGLFQK